MAANAVDFIGLNLVNKELHPVAARVEISSYHIVLQTEAADGRNSRPGAESGKNYPVIVML